MCTHCRTKFSISLFHLTIVKQPAVFNIKVPTDVFLLDSVICLTFCVQIIHPRRHPIFLTQTGKLYRFRMAATISGKHNR